ncbi:transposable element Tcb1 transposase [Trichonephila clavipes]|nr:transposable element Tcb1 transposase [Trichonephila clavipes]
MSSLVFGNDSKGDKIVKDFTVQVRLELQRRMKTGAEFVFMDDDTCFDRVNIVSECIQFEDINRMKWPVFSIDSNSIEHVWDMLGQRVTACQLPPYMHN